MNNPVAPSAPASGSPICTRGQQGASPETRSAPLPTSGLGEKARLLAAAATEASLQGDVVASLALAIEAARYLQLHKLLSPDRKSGSGRIND